MSNARPLADYNSSDTSLPCFEDSMVEVSGSTGLVILIINCIFPGMGTIFSSCLDRKGVNTTAMLVGLL